MVSWESRQGWCCPVCLYLPDGLQLSGWQAVQFTEILELICCVQDVHPRTPGVGSREYSGTDVHFYEIWLSWGSGRISCSLSKVKRIIARSPRSRAALKEHVAMPYITRRGRESSVCY